MSVVKSVAMLAFSSILLSAELRVATSPIEAGGTGPAVVYLLSQGRSVAGVQFDLTYDPHLSVSLDRGEAAIHGSKNLYETDVEPGRKRVLVVGLNQESMIDDALLILKIHVSGRTAGTYEVKVINPIAVDPNGDSVSVPEFIADVVVTASRRTR